jgi:hypothetical protein
MSESETIIFSDKYRKPDDDLIFSIIANKMTLWKEILSYLKDNFSDTSGDWNYYNDGKRWLFKMTQKKKTIFWAGIQKDGFRITFYFGDKAEPLIEASTLSQNLKDFFRNGKHYGKIRALTLTVSGAEDVESVRKLIDIKMRLK